MSLFLTSILLCILTIVNELISLIEIETLPTVMFVIILSVLFYYTNKYITSKYSMHFKNILISDIVNQHSTTWDFCSKEHIMLQDIPYNTIFKNKYNELDSDNYSLHTACEGDSLISGNINNLDFMISKVNIKCGCLSKYSSYNKTEDIFSGFLLMIKTKINDCKDFNISSKSMKLYCDRSNDANKLNFFLSDNFLTPEIIHFINNHFNDREINIDYIDSILYCTLSKPACLFDTCGDLSVIQKDVHFLYDILYLNKSLLNAIKKYNLK